MVFDTSAFVKLLIKEPETELVKTHFESTMQVAASRLLIVEVESALQKRLREQSLTLEMVQRAQSIAREILPSMHLLSVDGVLSLSQTLLQTAGPLRTLDAIHLATAQVLAAPFIVFDKQLRQAALRLGLQVIPRAI